MKKKRNLWMWLGGAAVVAMALGAIAPKDAGKPVRRGALRVKVSGEGKIESPWQIDQGSRVRGRIVEILVAESAPIKKGQVLVRIDDRASKADLDEAKANLNQARLTLARTRSTTQQNVTSKAQLDADETAMALAEARLARAQADYDDHVLTAPFDGVVITKHLDPDSFVEVGMPVLTLARTDALRVRVEIDETDLSRVRLGQAASLITDAFPGEVFHGKVSDLGQAIGRRKLQPQDPSKILDTKVLEILVALDPDPRLKIGMTVQADMITMEKKDVLLLPRSALYRDAQGPYALIPQRWGVPQRRPVKVGDCDDEDWEVLDGLTEGERIAFTP